MKTSLPSCFGALHFIALASALGACHPASPDPQPLTTSGLVGDWKISSIQISPAQNNTTDALALAKTLGNDGCINKALIGFDPNNRFHIDFDQECASTTKQSYFSYFSGITGEQWSIQNKQLVLSSQATTTYQGQTTTSTQDYVRYDVLGQGNQLILRWQAARDAMINPTQTVFSGSDSILFTYTVTLQNVWRP